MKTKEEVIKAAYGDMWSKLSENQQNYALKNNGTITFPPSKENGTPQLLSDLWDYFSKNGDKLYDQDYGNNFMSHHTPMSLKGIEDNNGWINVKDEFPKEQSIMYYGYKESWIDPDFCIDGVREFYYTGNNTNHDIYSFMWNDDSGEYVTVEKDIPTHWRIKNDFKKPLI